jgi:hypothetical protein
MDLEVESRKLELEIERAKRLAAGVSDQTTAQRLWGFVEEMKLTLQRRLAARRAKEEIRRRAHEIWEQHGHPGGRDLEF